MCVRARHPFLNLRRLISGRRRALHVGLFIHSESQTAKSRHKTTRHLFLNLSLICIMLEGGRTLVVAILSIRLLPLSLALSRSLVYMYKRTLVKNTRYKAARGTWFLILLLPCIHIGGLWILFSRRVHLTALCGGICVDAPSENAHAH